MFECRASQLIGLAIAMGVHGYTLVDALFWAVGCITTAGGDLHADNETLKVLYIVYMPIGAVAMLTAARTILQTSQRRAIRQDNYEVKIQGLLLHQVTAIGRGREPNGLKV